MAIWAAVQSEAPHNKLTLNHCQILLIQAYHRKDAAI